MYARLPLTKTLSVQLPQEDTKTNKHSIFTSREWLMLTKAIDDHLSKKPVSKKKTPMLKIEVHRPKIKDVRRKTNCI